MLVHSQFSSFHLVCLVYTAVLFESMPRSPFSRQAMTHTTALKRVDDELYQNIVVSMPHELDMSMLGISIPPRAHTDDDNCGYVEKERRHLMSRYKYAIPEYSPSFSTGGSGSLVESGGGTHLDSDEYTDFSCQPTPQWDQTDFTQYVYDDQDVQQHEFDDSSDVEPANMQAQQPHQQQRSNAASKSLLMSPEQASFLHPTKTMSVSRANKGLPSPPGSSCLPQQLFQQDGSLLLAGTEADVVGGGNMVPGETDYALTHDDTTNTIAEMVSPSVRTLSSPFSPEMTDHEADFSTSGYESIGTPPYHQEDEYRHTSVPLTPQISSHGAKGAPWDTPSTETTHFVVSTPMTARFNKGKLVSRNVHEYHHLGHGARQCHVPPEVMASLIDGPNEGKYRFTCLYKGCMKKFSRKYNIQSHIQTHLSDRPFRCPYCKAGFVRQHDLRRHCHIHGGAEARSWTCECGKAFARCDALTRHKQRGICVGSTVERKPPRTSHRKSVSLSSSGSVTTPPPNASSDAARVLEA